MSTNTTAASPALPSYYQMLEIAVRELLTDKGVVTDEQIAAAEADMKARGPERGARVVARAWLDPEYKQRLLQDGPKAVEEMGFDLAGMPLIVVENTPAVHNVIVCTLCSCYPRMLLGISPSWYKSIEYRSRVVHEPRVVLQEFGLQVPEHVEMRVHDSTADMRYMVLPLRPEGTEGWSELALSDLVTRNCLIGVDVPRVGVTNQAG
jgi:nitrile hydratase